MPKNSDISISTEAYPVEYFEKVVTEYRQNVKAQQSNEVKQNTNIQNISVGSGNTTLKSSDKKQGSQ